MSATQSATLLTPEIGGKLAATRRKLRAIDLALGLARAILAVAVVAVLLFSLDTALEPPLPVLRSFALFLGTVAGALVTLFLGRPVRRRLSDDDVALMVESEFPELQDGLVSAVQLSREDLSGTYTSQALVRSTIERASRQAEPLDFGRVVRTGPLVPLWLMIVAFLGLGFLLARHPTTQEYVDVFARRVFLGQALGYPKLVSLRVGRPSLQGVTVTKAADGRARVEDVTRIIAGQDEQEPPLQVGDLITGMDGTPIESFEQLSRQLGVSHREGDEVELTLQRGGQTVTAPGVVTTDIPAAVAKGDEVTVDVFASGKVTDGMILVMHTRYEGQNEEEVRDLVNVGQGHYRKTYQNVTNGFRFYVECPEHGVRSQEYRVAVVQRPRVEQYEFVLDYPDYTAKPTESVVQPDLQVPVGTEISYLVVSNKPLRSSRLVLELETLVDDPATGRRKRVTATEYGPPPQRLDKLPAGPEAGLAPGQVPLLDALKEPLERRELVGPKAGETQGRVLVGRFKVDRDLRFHYDLLSEEGYETGKKPVVFSVRAVADRPPTVSIPEPGRRKQVTPTAKVPLKIEASDDYGIRTLDLRFKPSSPGETSPKPVQEVALQGFQDGDKQVKLDYTIDMADLRLQPGDTLVYDVVAADHNIDEARQRKESRSYELAVVRPEDLERILQDRLTRLKEELQGGAREQSEARTVADAFVAELGPKEVLTDEDKRGLQRMGTQEKRVASHLAEIKRELTEIKTERALNRLEDDGASALLDELNAGVTELAEKSTPLIVRELEDARAAAFIDPGLRARMNRVPDLMREVEESLMALAARIDKWGDFTEMIQDWRDLKRDQDRLIEGTRAAAREQSR